MAQDVTTHMRIGPVDQCIYCLNDAQRPLTNEHIIPYSLDGTMLLLKASCSACNTATSSFELAVARTMMGAMRLRHNFPSRNRKELPSTVAVKAMYPDGEREVSVPIEDSAGHFPVLWFPPPGILIDRDPTLDVSIRGEFWRFPSELTAKSIGATALKYEATFDPKALARMLAKIGHAYAVAELGVDGFVPILLDVIHKRRHDVWHFVGGDPQTHAPLTHEFEKTIHELELYAHNNSEPWFITCQIRLFSTLKGPEGQGMPIYEIVVGHFNSHTAARLQTMPFYPCS